MVFNLRKSVILRIFSLLFLVFINSSQLPNYSSEDTLNNKLILSTKSNNLDKKFLKSEYILDANDILSISFNGLDIFSNLYKINLEGYLALPELGQLYAAGYTIKELKQTLEKEYEQYIIEPVLNISINRYRPVKFYLTGEVKNPGLYSFTINSKFSMPLNNSITLNNSGSVQNSLENYGSEDNSVLTPNLFNALQIAEGVNVYADLENIKITRKNSKTQTRTAHPQRCRRVDLWLHP